MSKDNQIRRYSIRKLSIGTASVLIGLTFVSGNNHIVHADELGDTDKASENSNQKQSPDSQKQAQVVQHIDADKQNSQNNLANNSQNEQAPATQNLQQANGRETAQPVNNAQQTVPQARAELNKASLEKSTEQTLQSKNVNVNANTASQSITVQKPTAKLSANSFKQSLAVNTADNSDVNKSVDDANKKVQQDLGDSGVVSGDDTVHKSGTIKYQDENGNQLHDDTKTDVDYVPYYKKAQGVISYVDGDTGQTLAIDNLYGYVGGKITIDQSTLEKYINQGYMVSRDDSLDKHYDQDNNQNSFTITLAHQKSTDPGTAVSSTTIATNYVVEFVDEDGNPLATPYVQSDKFVKDTDYTDQVTGKKHIGSGQWNMTHKEFDYVPAVSINGYTATKKELPGVTTTPDDPVKIGMIVYRKLGKFIPSYIIPGHPGVPDQIEPISGLSGTSYQTDPNDPSKLLKQQVLPTYDNYVADTDADGNNVASGFYTVSDPYKDTPIIYKSISEVDPGAKPVTKDASLIIKYVDDQGHNLLPDDRQSYTFDSSQTDDNGNEITKHAFRSVTVPVIDGYIADQSRIKQPTVTKDKPNLTITVTYRKLGKIIPVDSVTGEPIQGAEQPQYENDEFDATKIRDNIVVPQVGGYAPNDATVTPLDPLKNLPVKYVKNADKGQITINFVDDATGGTIQSKTLSGVVGETALYDPQEDIDYVRSQGYELDQNTLPNMLVFSKAPQSYSIGFNHKTYEINSGDGVNYDDGDPIDPSSPNGAKANMQDMIRTFTYTVHFEGAGAATPKDIVQKVIWTRHYSIDEATGNVIVHGDWQHNLSGEEYDAVTAPVIQTYHAEVLQAPSVKVDMQNHEYTIKYKRNGRLRLRMVDQVGKELKVIKGPYYITSPNDPRKVLPDEKVPLYENFIPDVRKVTPNNPDKDEIVVYRHQPDMVIVPVPVPTPGAPQPTVADVLMYTAKQIGIMPSNPVIIATQKAINSGDLVFPYDAGEGAEVGTNVVKNWVHLMRRSAPYNNVQNGAESSEKDPDKVDDGSDSTDANGADVYGTIHVDVPKQPNVGFDLLKTRAADTRDTSNTSSSLVHTPRDIDNATFISHFGDDDYDTWDGKGDIIDGTVIKTSKQGDITDETYNKINNTQDVKDNKHYSDRDFSSWDEENWDTLHYKYQDPYDKDLHTGNYVNDKPANDKYYGLPGVSIPEAKTPVSHDYAADKNPDAQGHGKHDVDQVKKGAKKASMLFTSFVAMPSQALNQSLAIMPGATFAKPMILAAIDDNDANPYGTPYYAIVSNGKVIAKDLTKDQMQEYKVKHDLPKIDGYIADDGDSASTTYDTPDGKVTVITYHKDSSDSSGTASPDNPDQPGGSTNTDNPSDHGQQSGSTNPDKPSNPDQPGGSTDTDNPSDHGQQGGLTNPDKPSNPEQPGGSTDTGNPSDHNHHGGSTNHGNPSDPDQPGGITNPDKPSNPSQPGDSTNPDKPSQPGDSTNPDKPGQQGGSTDTDKPSDHGQQGSSTDTDKPSTPDQPGGSTDTDNPSDHGEYGGSTDTGDPSNPGQQGGSTTSGQNSNSINQNHNEAPTSPSYDFGNGHIAINDINASQNGNGALQNNDLNKNRNSISNSVSSVNNRNSATAPADHKNNKKSAKNTESNKRGTRSAIDSNRNDRNHNIASNAITASGYRQINSAYNGDDADTSDHSYGYDESYIYSENANAYANNYAAQASTIDANQLSQSDNAFDNSNLISASNSSDMGQLPQTNASTNDAITALGFALISLASIGSFTLRKRE